jgi:hypothetical protein
MQACRGCLEADRATTENRILLITDAQPNQGDTTDEGLLARIKALAADGIHTTIVGAVFARGVYEVRLEAYLHDEAPLNAISTCRVIIPVFLIARARAPRRRPQAWVWTSTPSWWRR